MMMDQARQQSREELSKVFKDKVLPRYRPCVLRNWFSETWPEPTAWFTARLNYARTLAVMSMNGFVIG